jgi:hypothetical protein
MSNRQANKPKNRQTGGGAYIGGSVNTGGGMFVGRDFIYGVKAVPVDNSYSCPSDGIIAITTLLPIPHLKQRKGEP